MFYELVFINECWIVVSNAGNWSRFVCDKPFHKLSKKQKTILHLCFNNQFSDSLDSCSGWWSLWWAVFVCVSVCDVVYIYLFLTNFFFLIQHQLGISSINICWSKDNGTKNMNVAAWILFYIPLFVFYTIAFVVLGKKII